MSGRVRVAAPAKVNWTLEVLHVRPDGYHELRSILQTIDLSDVVTLSPARDVSVDVTGPEADVLLGAPPETNLAYRAAAALRERAGVRRGVHIVIEKRVPVAAGLGGGSSDAAAVLRGLNRLWGLREPRANLTELAAEIGSDPPFFVVGGTALAAGRGERIEPLPDAVSPPLLLATPRATARSDKTASMFRALTPRDYSEGAATLGLREAVEAGRLIVDDELFNVFERVTAVVQPDTERAMEALRAQGLTPHLAGAGPSFFLLLRDEGVAPALSARVRELGFEPRLTRALARGRAVRTRSL